MPSLPTIQPDDVAAAERASHAGAFDAPAADPHRGALVEYSLRLGDDALILGQRLAEWCGHAPVLELELSLANIGLDLIGQATFLLGLAGELEGAGGRSAPGTAEDGRGPSSPPAGRDADRLAFHRDVLAYRNCLMVEQPNGDFAQTIARQFLFSTYQQALYEAMTASSEPRLAEIAAKAVKEVRYHAELAAEWVVRLGDGTDESRARMIDGLGWHWRFVDELFQMDAVEQRLADAGIAVDKPALRPGYDATLARVLDTATIPLPTLPRAAVGGRKGHHSEHLGHLLAVMQYLPRSYPDASW